MLNGMKKVFDINMKLFIDFVRIKQEMLPAFLHIYSALMLFHGVYIFVSISNQLNNLICFSRYLVAFV